MKKLTGIVIVLCFTMLCSQTASAGHLEIIPINRGEQVTTSNSPTEVSEMTVHHSVKGNDVYIECIIPGFSFVADGVKKTMKRGEGHLHLHVNGKKAMDVNQAAFILKGLPKGKHEIKLELVHNNQKPYGIDDTFTVHIQ